MPKKGYRQSPEHRKKHSENRKGKKLSEAHKQNISESKKGSRNPMCGKPSPNRGKKLPEYQKKILTQGYRNFIKKNGGPMTGKHHSLESKKKMSESAMGRTSWNKGTGDPKGNALKRQIRYLNKLSIPFKLPRTEFFLALQSWTLAIRHNFNNQCQVCPSHAEISHHILHKSKYPTLSLNVNNGIALCKKCHNEVHGWKLNQ